MTTRHHSRPHPTYRATFVLAAAVGTAPYLMGVAVGGMHWTWLGSAAAPPLVVWRLWPTLRVVSHGRGTLVHSGPASPGTNQGGTP